MSGWNPQIADWMSRGLEWQYINQTTMRVFEIPANSQFQLPRGAYTFSYPEGVLIQFTGVFDHPSCGIRIESDPNFDTKELFSVNTVSLVLTRPDILVYVAIPPETPAGLFAIRIGSPWVWQNWLRIYLFNSDSVPHRVIGHGYHIAVLKDPRKEEEKVKD